MNKPGGFTWGGSFSTGFGNRQAQQEPEKPPFRYTCDMLLSDIPKDAVEDFVKVHNTVESVRKDARECQISPQVEETVAAIRRDTVAALEVSLIETGHLIDDADGSIKDMQHELQLSQRDSRSSSQSRVVPTPFIKRYVEGIERTAEFVRENVMAYRGEGITTSDGAKLFRIMLEKEHEAVLRCAERVSGVKAKLEAVQGDIERKLRVLIVSTSKGKDDDDPRVVDQIRTSYKQYVYDQSDKQRKRLEKADLLGKIIGPPQNKNSQGGFGSFGRSGGGFSGFSGLSGFGKTTTGTSTGSGFGKTTTGTSTGARSAFSGFGTNK